TINPGSHFGRETWQLVAVQQLLQTLDEKKHRLSHHLFGGRLEAFPRGSRGRLVDQFSRVRGNFERHRQYRLEPGNELEFHKRSWIRGDMQKLELQLNIDKEQRFLKERVPFDEPVLGVIGMWALGGGANPQFALTLACIMDVVGQKYIAWAGFERTKLMAGRYWKTQEERDFILKLCHLRQEFIEVRLNESGDDLRRQFNDELAFGRSYQRDYQKYEEDRLKGGLKPNSPGFYDEFFRGREGIESEMGSEDVVFVSKWLTLRKFLNKLPILLLGFGLGAFLGSFTNSRGDSATMSEAGGEKR
ncbi:MAG: hypothetical protein P1V97_09405, partial [Planctomycetota bacterium]|nr:hypothetical protein [Planctomycetota bacterium]